MAQSYYVALNAGTQSHANAKAHTSFLSSPESPILK